jgi:hypothetical protein
MKIQTFAFYNDEEEIQDAQKAARVVRNKERHDIAETITVEDVNDILQENYARKIENILKQ